MSLSRSKTSTIKTHRYRFFEHMYSLGQSGLDLGILSCCALKAVLFHRRVAELLQCKMAKTNPNAKMNRKQCFMHQRESQAHLVFESFSLFEQKVANLLTDFGLGN
jgi:hypothetical protein